MRSRRGLWNLVMRVTYRDRHGELKTSPTWVYGHYGCGRVNPPRAPERPRANRKGHDQARDWRHREQQAGRAEQARATIDDVLPLQRCSRYKRHSLRSVGRVQDAE